MDCCLLFVIVPVTPDLPWPMSEKISFMERERGSPQSILVTFILKYTSAFALLFGNLT